MSYKKFCKTCEKETEWRYLDCEDCRAADQECIDICSICGCDDTGDGDTELVKKQNAEMENSEPELENTIVIIKTVLGRITEVTCTDAGVKIFIIPHAIDDGKEIPTSLSLLEWPVTQINEQLLKFALSDEEETVN